MDDVNSIMLAWMSSRNPASRRENMGTATIRKDLSHVDTRGIPRRAP